MSITNEERYHLHTKATKVLGQKEGTTLMEMLPPVGWAELATKEDLKALQGVMRTGFAEQNSAFQTDLRKMQGVLLGALVSVVTLATAILGIIMAAVN